MNAGGAETFLMKLYRNIDRNKYQLDFCVNISEKGFYDEEIKKLGGRIYVIPCKSEDLFGFKKGLVDIVKTNHYGYVFRITSNAMGFWDLKIAKKAGAKCCIARSSNSSDGGSLKSIISHKLGTLLYRKYVDIALAPSDLAAIYTFGKRAYENGKVHILHNAVDLDIYKFDLGQRNAIRQEFAIMDDVIVIGHIGRFSEQKNHLFLIEIFKQIHELNLKTVLFLVGDGPDKKKIENRIKELQIEDSVIFTGIRSDIPNLLSAMDVFVFPSLYEGMPNIVIEAQATGLPCVISDTITKEANITNLVEYLPLGNIDLWAERVIAIVSRKRKSTIDAFINHKYDIDSVTEEFVRLIRKK